MKFIQNIKEVYRIIYRLILKYMQKVLPDQLYWKLEPVGFHRTNACRKEEILSSSGCLMSGWPEVFPSSKTKPRQ
jgi:hypothetical protein